MRLELGSVKPLNQKKHPGVYQFSLHVYTDTGTPILTCGGMRLCFEGEKAGQIWDTRVHTPKFWITVCKVHPILHDRLRSAMAEIVPAALGSIEQRETTRNRKLTSDEKASVWAGISRVLNDPPPQP